MSNKQIALINHLLIDRGIAKKFNFAAAKEWIIRQFIYSGVESEYQYVTSSMASELISAIKDGSVAFEVNF